MTDTTRNDYGCYLGTDYERKIVAWMTEHGKPEYAQAIDAAQTAHRETIGDAGRYWMHCPFTGDRLAVINNEITETFQAATDRYEDWASD